MIKATVIAVRTTNLVGCVRGGSLSFGCNRASHRERSRRSRPTALILAIFAAVREMLLRRKSSVDRFGAVPSKKSGLE